MKRVISQMNLTEITNCYGMTETSPVSFQTVSTTHSNAVCRPWVECIRMFK